LALARRLVALTKHLTKRFECRTLGHGCASCRDFLPCSRAVSHVASPAREALRVAALRSASGGLLGSLLDLLVRSPDAMWGIGVIVIFPLSFMARTFVPIAGMDVIPRAIAQWAAIAIAYIEA
jgi:hypothetical protein